MQYTARMLQIYIRYVAPPQCRRPTGLATTFFGQGTVGVCGTPPYMSPEMLCHLSYDGRTDVWSPPRAGCIALVDAVERP